MKPAAIIDAVIVALLAAACVATTPDPGTPVVTSDGQPVTRQDVPPSRPSSRDHWRYAP